MELKIYDQQDKRDLYNELKRYQLPYKVRVEPIFQKRTNEQNRYYYGIVVKTLSELLGYYPHEMHLLLLKMFAKVGEGLDDYGEPYILVESTAGMSTMRIEKYMDDIRNYFLIEVNIYIPEIGETFEAEYNEKIIYE